MGDVYDLTTSELEFREVLCLKCGQKSLQGRAKYSDISWSGGAFPEPDACHVCGGRQVLNNVLTFKKPEGVDQT